MNEQKIYSPKKVCEEVGISHRQLGYWGLIGVIHPTKKAHGSKVFNHYTDEDIATLKRVKRLTEEGFFVSKAAEKIHRSLSEQPEAPHENGYATEDSYSQGTSSSLYLDIRLNEELIELKQSGRPLSCMALRVSFPLASKSPQEKNNILFDLSRMLAAQKGPSDVICYEKESIFLWLLPNRTLEAAVGFSGKIKRAIEEFQWRSTNENLKLKIVFGFSSYSSVSQNGYNLLKDAVANLPTTQKAN